MVIVLFLTNYCKKDEASTPVTCSGGGFYYNTSNSIMIVPNAFTPNGDGLNDRFGAVGSNFSKFSMTIKDYTGTLLFADSSIVIWWDGKNTAGKIVGGHYKANISFKNAGGSVITRAIDIMLYADSITNGGACKFGDMINPTQGFIYNTTEKVK